MGVGKSEDGKYVFRMVLLPLQALSGSHALEQLALLSILGLLVSLLPLPPALLPPPPQGPS